MFKYNITYSLIMRKHSNFTEDCIVADRGSVFFVGHFSGWHIIYLYRSLDFHSTHNYPGVIQTGYNPLVSYI